MVLRISKKSQPGVVKVIEHTAKGKVIRVESVPVAKKSTPKKVKPLPPVIALSQPGRLRVANLLSLFAVSRTTLYSGMQTGRYPPPDGKDGRLPYWNTETVRVWLEKAVATK